MLKYNGGHAGPSCEWREAHMRQTGHIGVLTDVRFLTIFNKGL